MTNLDPGVIGNCSYAGLIDKTGKTVGCWLPRFNGDPVFNQQAADDFGVPDVDFNIRAFWRIDALARIGRREEARELLFVSLLESRNSLGLLSEDTDCITGEMRGNYPQTYSRVGIINGARRLSRPWESVI